MSPPRDLYFGQGPKMFRPAVAVAIVGSIAAWLEPDVFLMAPRFMQPLRMLLGWMFILAGAALYLWGAVRMVPAVKSGKLDTGGPFALVRHPMYSAWIVFIFPGIAMVSGAWVLFGSSLAAWAFFRKWAPVEEAAMLERFGEPYAEYMRKVRGLFPFPN